MPVPNANMFVTLQHNLAAAERRKARVHDPLAKRPVMKHHLALLRTWVFLPKNTRTARTAQPTHPRLQQRLRHPLIRPGHARRRHRIRHSIAGRRETPRREEQKIRTPGPARQRRRLDDTIIRGARIVQQRNRGARKRRAVGRADGLQHQRRGHDRGDAVAAHAAAADAVAVDLVRQIALAGGAVDKAGGVDGAALLQGADEGVGVGDVGPADAGPGGGARGADAVVAVGLGGGGEVEDVGAVGQAGDVGGPDGGVGLRRDPGGEGGEGVVAGGGGGGGVEDGPGAGGEVCGVRDLHVDGRADGAGGEGVVAVLGVGGGGDEAGVGEVVLDYGGGGGDWRRIGAPARVDVALWPAVQQRKREMQSRRMKQKSRYRCQCKGVTRQGMMQGGTSSALLNRMFLNHLKECDLIRELYTWALMRRENKCGHRFDRMKRGRIGLQAAVTSWHNSVPVLESTSSHVLAFAISFVSSPLSSARLLVDSSRGQNDYKKEGTLGRKVCSGFGKRPPGRAPLSHSRIHKCSNASLLLTARS
ncbi:hypothetical protein FH972_024195 [Carpinus fangiana]|uniref:Uncharacterized protein n=1 Tax=Carpinus fangiana TaxID=176857 RepID=A0A5N6KXU7_9ROSI|nr:hypothetical protein FH972_024195 [Carpinus fangiana]